MAAGFADALPDPRLTTLRGVAVPCLSVNQLYKHLGIPPNSLLLPPTTRCLNAVMLRSNELARCLPASGWMTLLLQL